MISLKKLPKSVVLVSGASLAAAQSNPQIKEFIHQALIAAANEDEQAWRQRVQQRPVDTAVPLRRSLSVSVFDVKAGALEFKSSTPLKGRNLRAAYDRRD